MVRVWSTDDGQRMVRVQVRHIQTDVEESGTAVPLHWVAITLAQFLAAREDREPGTPG